MIIGMIKAHPTKNRMARQANPAERWAAHLVVLRSGRLARPEPSTPRSPTRRAARLATARYATSLRAARAAGYQIITQIPDMGSHLLNPAIQGFDVRKPPILVYACHGRAWQLVALEWAFLQQPEAPRLPAPPTAFDPAYHYRDGTFVVAVTPRIGARTQPPDGFEFNFWHPKQVTLHVWSWYPNPAGLYSGTNPLMRPLNR